MKKILLSVLAAIIAAPAFSATLRVNNTSGSGAIYTSVADALVDAKDGDVIIVDGSNDSYGDIEISKRITLQGPGYYLKENEVTTENVQPAKFNTIKVYHEDVKITGVTVSGTLTVYANNVVVTRNNIRNILLGNDFSYTENAISNVVFHQNFILGNIMRDSYSSSCTFIQITNNIFARSNNVHIRNIDQSVIAYNTFVTNECSLVYVTGSTIEHNIGTSLTSAGVSNTYTGNYLLSGSATKIYGNSSSDKEIKAIEAGLTVTAGAFAGKDPYVLSGLVAGPVIKDIEMPASVVKGEELKVTVRLGISE